MVIRLLVILGLLIQPLVLGCNAFACGSVSADAVSTTNCCGPRPSCCGGDEVERSHDCGNPAAMCRCGVSAQQPPVPAPSRGQQNSSELLATILPRVVAVAMRVPEPARVSLGAVGFGPAAAGLGLRAFLCVWLT